MFYKKHSLIAVLITVRILSEAILAARQDDGNIWDLSQSTRAAGDSQKLRLWITISAQKRFLEVSWVNAPCNEGDHILLTKQEPYKFEKVRVVRRQVPLATFEGSGSSAADGGDNSFRNVGENSRRVAATTTATNLNNMHEIEVNSFDSSIDDATTMQRNLPKIFWISNNGVNDIVAAMKPSIAAEWFTTGVPFDYALSRNVTKETSAYGFWASYINDDGDILATTAIRAYPHWMHDLHSVVNGMRLRDLFIPGTHDSGSYRPNFDPLVRETLVTKYALTQDDDIRGQLMHGARYLDIRVGYYRNTPELFFINHGITKQRPLIEIIEQVRDFVLETNEIVIFGLKEFPVGFGKRLGIHRLLVNFLQEKFGDLIVHPSLTWSASLRDIWLRKQNIIIAYDKPAIVQEFPQTLFGAVEQRWGNVQTWERLKSHLKTINTYDTSRLSSRPVADMAELTPETWDVILDKHGGLRKMADSVNWRISQMYRDELGEHANIVAVDFMRGTNLMETAIDYNKRKVIL